MNCWACLLDLTFEWFLRGLCLSKKKKKKVIFKVPPWRKTYKRNIFIDSCWVELRDKLVITGMHMGQSLWDSTRGAEGTHANNFIWITHHVFSTLHLTCLEIRGGSKNPDREIKRLQGQLTRVNSTRFQWNSFKSASLWMEETRLANGAFYFMPSSSPIHGFSSCFMGWSLGSQSKFELHNLGWDLDPWCDVFFFFLLEHDVRC